MAFIDEQRAQGHAVESICRVLREQGLAIAARTYRFWKRANRPVADRTHSDTQVLDAVLDLAWMTEKRIDTRTGEITERRRLAPEGLYGRRKMTALVRRRRLPEASAGSVNRAMRALGLCGVRRDKGIRGRVRWAV